MKKFTYIALVLAVASLLGACNFSGGDSFEEDAESLKSAMAIDGRAGTKNLPNIIVCDQTTRCAIMLDPAKDWKDPSAVVWKWDPSAANGMNAKYAGWFGNISDCKPVLGGTHALVAASFGGVALVRLSDSKVEFFANAEGNVHSAALLPDGNVVVASSTGNYLTLFDNSQNTPGVPCTKGKRYFLDFSHGVVWDSARNVLWALARNELAEYEYNFDKSNPELVKRNSYPLPPECLIGHDLYPVAGSDHLLFVTGHDGVAVFDAVSRTFQKVSDIRDVKSVSLSAAGGAIIFLVPEEQWWSQSVVFGGKAMKKVGTLPNARIYKARFFVPDTFGAF